MFKFQVNHSNFGDEMRERNILLYYYYGYYDYRYVFGLGKKIFI